MGVRGKARNDAGKQLTATLKVPCSPGEGHSMQRLVLQLLDEELSR